MNTPQSETNSPLKNVTQAHRQLLVRAAVAGGLIGGLAGGPGGAVTGAQLGGTVGGGFSQASRGGRYGG